MNSAGEPTYIQSLYELTEYDLPGISIPTAVVYADSEADSYCPSAFNAPLMDRISGITSSWVSGLEHTGFVKDNDTSLTDIIKGTLPELAIPITAEGICPAKKKQKKQKSNSSDSDSGSDSPDKFVSCSSSDCSDEERNREDERIPTPPPSRAEIRMNTRLNMLLSDMDLYLSTGEGRPRAILRKLNRLMSEMDARGFERPNLSQIEGYDDLVEKV